MAVPMQKTNYEPKHVLLMASFWMFLAKYKYSFNGTYETSLLSVSLIASATSSVTSPGCTCLDVTISSLFSAFYHINFDHFLCQVILDLVFWKKSSPALDLNLSGPGLVWWAFEFAVYSLICIYPQVSWLTIPKLRKLFGCFLVSLCLLCENLGGGIWTGRPNSSNKLG